MFDIKGNKSYKVNYIRGGEGAKTKYTFITIEDELVGSQKYPNKLKINVWGDNLSNEIQVGDFIKVNDIFNVGESRYDRTDAKTGTVQTVRTVAVSCNGKHIEKVDGKIGGAEEQKNKDAENKDAENKSSGENDISATLDKILSGEMGESDDDLPF